MTRIGVQILLVGFLLVGVGGLGYVLPFVVPFTGSQIEAFETGILLSWGIGAALIVVGGVLALLGSVAAGLRRK